MTVTKPPMIYVGTNGNNISPGGHPALAIVCHIMEGTLEACDAWFANPAAQASASYGVGADGTIHCYVDPTSPSPFWPWANGIVQNPDASGQALIAKGQSLYGNVSPNVYTVSIEHAGYSGQPIPAAEWIASEKLCAWLAQEFGITPVHGTSTDSVLGHYQIDSVNRSGCPGWTADQWDVYIGNVNTLLASTPAVTIDEARKYAADATARINNAIADLEKAKESLMF